jgi:hypothetical protein
LVLRGLAEQFEESAVRDVVKVPPEQRNAISRIAHIIGRVGLAMAGTLCGLFVAACVIRGKSDALDAAGLVMTMCLIGMVGFYLGVDIPRSRAQAMRTGKGGFELELNPVELLSASGTFLTAMAALVSVSVIILDEPLELTATVMVGCVWLAGATMQISAGAIARLCTAGQSVG